MIETFIILNILLSTDMRASHVSPVLCPFLAGC
nr:MAG TPA: hypothetical protein [Caudoviricetes sp.]